MLRGALILLRGVAPAPRFSAFQITLCRGISQSDFKEKILYEGGEPTMIHAMLASGVVTAYCSSYYTLGSIFFHGEAVKFAFLFGNPLWGGLGFIAACGLFYITRQYSFYTIKTCYLTADGAHIGFQCFTMLALPGRRIETSPLNIKLSKTPTSTYLAVTIKGLDFNLFLDTNGRFHDTNLLKMLDGQTELVPKFNPVAMKQQRTTHRKSMANRVYHRSAGGDPHKS